MSIVLDANV